MPRKDSEAAGIVSKSALARELSISRERVGVYVERGMPTLPDGRLDRSAALAWVAANIDAGRSPRARIRAAGSVPDAEASGGAPSFADARRALEIIRVQEGKLRLQKARGEVIDRALMQKTVFDLARMERDAWLNWPGRVSATMAAKLGVDAAALHMELEREVRAHLTELAPVTVPEGDEDRRAVG